MEAALGAFRRTPGVELLGLQGDFLDALSGSADGAALERKAVQLETGRPGPLLRHAARASQRSWERGMRKAMALLEPLLIVGVGGLILIGALSVLLPMLRMNQGLG